MLSNIGVNKVILLGNAGHDAEMRSTFAGKSVANFSLAINQSFRDEKEGIVQRIEWVRCVARASWRKSPKGLGRKGSKCSLRVASSRGDSRIVRGAQRL